MAFPCPPSLVQFVVCEHPYVVQGKKTLVSCVGQATDQECRKIVRVDLPGVCQESARVWLGNDSDLNIEGVEDAKNIDQEFDGEDSPRKFKGQIPLPKYSYKPQEMKYVVKNGALKVMDSLQER